MASPRRSTAIALRWKLLAGSLVPVVFVVASAVLGTRALDASEATTAWVTHTDEVIAGVHDLMKLVLDAETGQRGYILTRDRRFLEPYEAGVPAFYEKIASLETSVADDPTQVDRLRRIDALFQQWQREIAESNIREPDGAVGRAPHAKEIIDHIRALVGELLATEQGLLGERRRATESANARARSVTLFGAGISVVALLGIAIYFSSTIGRSLADIAATARALSRGDLARRVRVRRRDELGVLGDAFNLMAERLVARSEEAISLAALADELHACLNLDEALGAVLRFASRRAGEQWGAVYLLAASRDVAVRRGAWGTGVTAEAMVPEACWALRKGHIHHVEDTTAGTRCEHVEQGAAASTLCVPLAAHGDTIGVLHAAEPVGGLDEPRRRFLASVAEQLALAAANLMLRERLQAQSIRDPLTGAFNRRYLEETLPRETARAERSGQALAILALDVDHFKRFNDTFGHEAGDVVLRELGKLLTSSSRGGDIAARLGGEEFVIVLPNSEEAKAVARAERLREAVKQLALSLRGTSLGTVSVSIGVALFPATSANPEDLLRAADVALYRAKSEGRDRVVVAAAAPALPVLASAPPEPLPK